VKLATIRTTTGTRAVRVEDDHLVDIGQDDLGALLAEADWKSAARADGDHVSLDDVDFAPLVPAPGKVFCVGLNYSNHILEMGRNLPDYPTLFTKYAESLIGANDPIVKPTETDQFDWEAELAVVIGAKVRRAKGEQAEAAIAGFATLNDLTCRDWQYRTTQWLQGKAWEGTTPVGPYLVTPDELPGGVRPELEISSVVDGETMQQSNTSELVFDPVRLVEYISTFITLRPGDIIATGTPGGVGHARKPPQYLTPGKHLVTEVARLGRCSNNIIGDGRPARGIA